MSEFTTVTLIKERSGRLIIDKLRRLYSKSYLIPVNEEWNAVVMENDGLEEGKIARQLSEKLDTYTFFLINSVDYGWNYTLYSKGRISGYLNVNYERKEISALNDANFPLLKQISANPSEIDHLESWYNEFVQRATPTHRGIQLFKKAFNFEPIEWVSFDYLSSMDERGIQKLNTTVLEGKAKRMNTRKIILDVLEKPLYNNGYVKFDAERLRLNGGEIAFIFTEDDFDYGLVIDASRKNIIEAKIYAPMFRGRNMYYIIEKSENKTFKYGNERELRKYLLQILDFFLNRGVQWLRENKIEKFDANQVYYEIMDPFLEELEFERVKTDYNVFDGGEIIYSKNGRKIIFRHFKYYTNLMTLFIKNNEEVALSRLLLNNKEKLGIELDNFRVWFRNKKEFENLLLQIINYIKRFNIID